MVNEKKLANPKKKKSQREGEGLTKVCKERSGEAKESSEKKERQVGRGAGGSKQTGRKTGFSKRKLSGGIRSQTQPESGRPRGPNRHKKTSASGGGPLRRRAPMGEGHPTCGKKRGANSCMGSWQGTKTKKKTDPIDPKPRGRASPQGVGKKKAWTGEIKKVKKTLSRTVLKEQNARITEDWGRDPSNNSHRDESEKKGMKMGKGTTRGAGRMVQAKEGTYGETEKHEESGNIAVGSEEGRNQRKTSRRFGKLAASAV